VFERVVHQGGCEAKTNEENIYYIPLEQTGSSEAHTAAACITRGLQSEKFESLYSEIWERGRVVVCGQYW